MRTLLHLLLAMASFATGALQALHRAGHAAWLRYVIWETEAWIRACEADGLHHSLHLTQVRHELAANRVQLILLETRP